MPHIYDVIVNGSGAENPTLTILALSMRNAAHLVEMRNKGEI